MAGMVVTTTEDRGGSVWKIVWSWQTDDADGTATGATTAEIDGELFGMTTIPDGSAAPSVDYDITITDDGSHDVLLGAGADRHTANTEHVLRASLAAVASSVLTLNVSAAGNAKEGVVVLYVR